jgi:hypothetical protein
MLSLTGTTTATALAPLPIALAIKEDPSQSASLWAISAHQRVDAMWAGKRTLSQLTEWSRRRPHELPLLGRELAWIVMRTPGWNEADNDPRHNVVHLAQRSKCDRAAA